MLWDLIRDFFVQNIFGGVDSSQNAFQGSVGLLTNTNNDYFEGTTNNIALPIGSFIWTDGDTISESGFISLGDYLSTTATIISISIIVVLCCLFVYKIIKLIGGLIR